MNVVVTAKDSRGLDAVELAKTMVAIYEQVKKNFTVEKKSHYIFTPRELTAWVVNIMNYDLVSNELLTVMAYEGERLFCAQSSPGRRSK